MLGSLRDTPDFGKYSRFSSFSTFARSTTASEITKEPSEESLRRRNTVVVILMIIAVLAAIAVILGITLYFLYHRGTKMHRIFESIYFYFRSLREAAGRPVLNLNKNFLSHTLFVFTAIIRAHINFTIYNRNFTDAMDNHTSADFKNIAEPLCDEVGI